MSNDQGEKTELERKQAISAEKQKAQPIELIDADLDKVAGGGASWATQLGAALDLATAKLNSQTASLTASLLSSTPDPSQMISVAEGLLSAGGVGKTPKNNSGSN